MQLTEQTLLSRRFWLLLPIITVLIGGAFIRVYHLASVPPGVASDSALTLADALRISHGYPYPATFGTEPEPLYRYLLAGWMLLVGPGEVPAMIFQTLFALITIALTYRAGLVLLKGQQWSHLGALIAAAAMAALTPHVFLSRNIYRIILMPPVVLVTFIALLDASRTRRKLSWALGGFCAALCVHIYPAGLVAPFWAVGFVLHHWLTALVLPKLPIAAPAHKRLKVNRVTSPSLNSERRPGAEVNSLYTFAGMIPPLLLWYALYKLVPNLYGPTMGWSGASNALQSIIDGFSGAIRAYFLVGHHLPNFNAPNAPFLNPLLAIPAIIGIGLALLRFYRADGALFLGGLILFTVPGALTSDTTYPLRYAGCMPLLCLLAGWGASAAASLISQPRALQPLIKPLLSLATAALILFSLASAHVAYQDTFADPQRYVDPRNWTSVPHNYSLAFEHAMKYLAETSTPTYMPLWLLDNPVSQYFLQRDTYPTVTTWARSGLTELPAGQFFMPAYWMYHMPAEDTSTGRVLLLPAQKRIVLLPATRLPDSIAGALPNAGDPGVTVIQDPYGWELGRTRPVERAPLDLPQLPAVESLPTIGTGLHLLSAQAISPVTPGKPVTVLLEWQVTAPQPADIFSVVQLIDQHGQAVGGSQHHIMFYLFPSAMWQPGDIVPDWHVIDLPANLPDGIYRWGAGAYVPPKLDRLPVIDPPVPSGPQMADLWLWDSIRFPAPTIGAPLSAGVRPLAAQIGTQIAVEGYQFSRENDQLSVTLYWRTNGHPGSDYTIFIHAEREGQLIAQCDKQPDPPTWAWAPGELITTNCVLALPPGSPHPDHVYAGMYSFPSLERAPVTQNGTPSPDRRIVLTP